MKAKLLLLACLMLPSTWAPANTISSPASLNKKVSADTFAYIRIPNAWGLLSAPKGNSINDALANPAHQEQVAQLKKGVAKNILAPLAPQTGALLSLILDELSAPIEAMAITPKASPSPLPSVAIRTQLSMRDVTSFKALITQLSNEIPIQIKTPVADDGTATLQIDMAMVMLKFDASNGRLNMLAGQVVNQAAFDEFMAMPDVSDPVFTADEQQIDSSGQGLFIWLNAKKILPMAQAGMPPEAIMGLQQAGLLDATSAAAGMGMSNGKGRLQVILNVPHTGLRKSIPPIMNNFSLTSSGTPAGMVSLSVLNLDLLKGIESLMQMMSPTDYTDYIAAQKDMKASLGYDVRDIFSAIGPETLFFADDAGSYLAIRLRDSAKFYEILSKLRTMFGLTYETITINNVSHHHLIIPGIALPDVDGSNFFMTLLSRSATHLYWVEDNGYLLMAQIPQMLMDHQSTPNRQTIQHWLEKQQRQNGQHSLALMSLTLENMPTEIYNAYLLILDTLGDLADQPVDLYQLPSAKQVSLAHDGTLGFQVDMSDKQLGFGITYESTMLDFILDPGAGSVVVVAGVMAAVAIPAYQDYTVRAQVGEAMAQTSAYKIAVSEFFYLNNKLPTTESEIGIDASQPYGSVKNISMGTDAAINVELMGSNLYGGTITLTPVVENGVVRWECSAQNIQASHLPQSCRPQY